MDAMSHSRIKTLKKESIDPRKREKLQTDWTDENVILSMVAQFRFFIPRVTFISEVLVLAMFRFRQIILTI